MSVSVPDARYAPTVSDAGAFSAPKVDGKFLSVQGQRLWIKGVTYGSFAPNDDGEPFPPFPVLIDDFAQMADAGINTVRLYSPPSDRIADAAAEYGLYLVPDICWGPRKCELDDPERVRFIHRWTQGHCRRLAGHPAMLMYGIGNEIPPLVVRWYGRHRIERFLRTLSDIVREEVPEAIITYASHPPTEHLHLPFLDVVSYNVYLEREIDFRRYLARLQSLAGDRPLFLAELGLDSMRHGPREQARFLEWQLRAVFEKGLCGAAVYSWTDEWSIFAQNVSDWSFGLVDVDRRPKPALAATKQIYESSLYTLRRRNWPRVSVVVASYNGARTLQQCLESLAALRYPDYEIIVVDDGSRDHTPDIVAQHDVHCIRVPNGGLSRARNLGIAAASGEIVAFIDSDAYADPDWLYYLVTAMDEQQAAAVGGPNLAPPDDGFISACVDLAPGNPTHVLIGDERAEHVPGCNMAFRKNVLAQIGGFDPTHRAAGDDVDVCWKLLLREETIAFSPSAFVWHHRRASIAGFLRQQRGYGYAEAHLKQRHPARFNVFGDLVWEGSLYDGAHLGLRQQRLPILAKPRVYQGRFGSAQFQSLYQPAQAWWFQIATTAEWQVLTWSVAAAGLLNMPWHLGRALVLLVIAATLFAATLASGFVTAASAVRSKRWPGDSRIRALGTVLFLHLVQPLARALGHMQGWWAVRRMPQVPSVQRLYGNLAQREEWLERLQRHLQACGWHCRACCDWDDADLEILGPGPYSLRLRSVYEDDVEHGRHYVRFRVWANRKRWTPLVWAGVLAGVPLFVVAPAFLPLALPWVYLCRGMIVAKRHMRSAIAQLAIECAEPLGMAKAENQ